MNKQPNEMACNIFPGMTVSSHQQELMDGRRRGLFCHQVYPHMNLNPNHSMTLHNGPNYNEANNYNFSRFVPRHEIQQTNLQENYSNTMFDRRSGHAIKDLTSSIYGHPVKKQSGFVGSNPADWINTDQSIPQSHNNIFCTPHGYANFASNYLSSETPGITVGKKENIHNLYSTTFNELVSKVINKQVSLDKFNHAMRILAKKNPKQHQVLRTKFHKFFTAYSQQVKSDETKFEKSTPKNTTPLCDKFDQNTNLNQHGPAFAPFTHMNIATGVNSYQPFHPVQSTERLTIPQHLFSNATSISPSLQTSPFNPQNSLPHNGAGIHVNTCKVKSQVLTSGQTRSRQSNVKTDNTHKESWNKLCQTTKTENITEAVNANVQNEKQSNLHSTSERIDQNFNLDDVIDMLIGTGLSIQKITDVAMMIVADNPNLLITLSKNDLPGYIRGYITSLKGVDIPDDENDIEYSRDPHLNDNSTEKKFQMDKKGCNKETGVRDVAFHNHSKNIKCDVTKCESVSEPALFNKRRLDNRETLVELERLPNQKFEPYLAPQDASSDDSLLLNGTQIKSEKDLVNHEVNVAETSSADENGTLPQLVKVEPVPSNIEHSTERSEICISKDQDCVNLFSEEPDTCFIDGKETLMIDSLIDVNLQQSVKVEQVSPNMDYPAECKESDVACDESVDLSKEELETCHVAATRDSLFTESLFENLPFNVKIESSSNTEESETNVTRNEPDYVKERLNIRDFEYSSAAYQKQNKVASSNTEHLHSSSSDEQNSSGNCTESLNSEEFSYSSTKLLNVKQESHDDVTCTKDRADDLNDVFLKEELDLIFEAKSVKSSIKRKGDIDPECEDEWPEKRSKFGS